MDTPYRTVRTCSLAWCAAGILGMTLATPAGAAAACVATSGRETVPLVELFTSEGCDSCPPADRWLSATFPSVRAAASASVLAFHVDYWDRLGWKDRFASPAFTQRQAQQQVPSGARFSYTPQVVVDGPIDLTGLWDVIALDRPDLEVE